MIPRIKWKVSGQQFEFNNFESLFIFPVFIKLNLSEDGEFILSQNQLIQLASFLSREIDDLFLYRYVQPSDKEIQKKASRFEKINHNGIMKKVNYRTDEIGRLLYSLSSFLNSIQAAKENAIQLSIETLDNDQVNIT